MAKKRTELEARLIEEHGRVINVVQRWQSEQQAVDEARVSLAVAESRLDQAVLECADLGDRSLVARLLDLPEAQVRKAIAASRRAAKRRDADDPLASQTPEAPTERDSELSATPTADRAGRVGADGVE